MSFTMNRQNKLVWVSRCEEDQDGNSIPDASDAYKGEPLYNPTPLEELELTNRYECKSGELQQVLNKPIGISWSEWEKAGEHEQV